MEDFRFLLKDVELEQRKVFPKVDPVLYQSAGILANERQFQLHVPEVADYYAEDGKTIFLHWKAPLQKNAVELYLNGSVLGSILHQRNILTLHGSSFQMSGRTVIICGHSGFGKSSLTFTLCKLYAAGFLTDDVTPIQEGRIMQISESLKLWKDALEELGLHNENLRPVYPDMEKYHVRLQGTEKPAIPDLILYGEIGGDAVRIEELQGAEKFEKTLLNQYWKELTTSMIGSRAGLFTALAQLCNDTRMFRFRRPENSPLEETAEALIAFLNSLES
jgi:hypothetical protein